MKAKQLLLVLVLLVVLGGAALWLSQRNRATWNSSAAGADAKVLNFPVNDVTHVTIKGGDAETNLVKKDDIWTVQERADYPADFAKVSFLLRRLWELKPVQEVKVGASQLSRLQLTEPSAEQNSGTLIDLKSAGDKRLAGILFGKNQLRDAAQLSGPGGYPVGRYVMTEDGSNRVSLISETFADLQTQPERWVSLDFVKIENPKLIRLTSATPELNWTLTRENATAPWKLSEAKPGEELDPSKVATLTSLFSNPVVTDVLPPDAPPLEQPSVAHFETFDGFTYEIRIGKLNGENYPVQISVQATLPNERTPAANEKPEDKARLDQEFQPRQQQLRDKLAREEKFQARQFVISTSTLDQLLKDRGAFVAEKKPSPSAPATTSPTPAAKAPSVSPSPHKR